MPTYLDNTSNLQELNDFGLKISKIGFDALTTSDKDLVYNSSWPSIQIVKTIRFDGSTFKFEHNLGFPPFAVIMGGYTGGVMVNLPCDEINVYVPTIHSGNCLIVIYNIDISVDVEYPYTVQSGGNASYNYDYGIKMVKQNKDINSEDMRDYILHTRCGSPLILAVKTQDTANSANPNMVQYTSKLGYPTLNFGYARIIASSFLFVTYDGLKRYYNAPLQSQSFPYTVTNGYTTRVSFGTTSDGATVVCLRNPNISSTNSVSVTY